MRFSHLTITLLLTGIAAGIFGCGVPYVAEIGNEKISAPEFEHEFEKNNGLQDSTKLRSPEERQKFLDLYIKFRLKVKEAKNLGYDKDPEIQAELGEYRKNLAVSYMIEKQITAPAIEELYRRKQNELRASHILLRLPQNPTPQDTLTVYMEAQQLIDSLDLGVPFDSLAVRHSEDQSVHYNKGDIYYFTAGSLVPEFEDAVYSLKVGQYTKHPVRTQFGYHIIKLTDMQKNQKAVHVSHIMKRLMPNSTKEDSMKAEHELLAIRDSVLRGGDFAEYAKKYSDDTYSATRGGDLGYVDRGRTVRPFDEAIFTMKDGDVSGIVHTQFGYHLIKRFDAKGIPPFAEMEPELKTEYQRNRFQRDYDSMVNRLKKMYNFTMVPSAYEAFAMNADTSKNTNDSSWDSTYTANIRSQVLYTFAGQSITIDSAIALAKINQDLKNMDFKLPSTVKTIADKIGSNLVVDYYATQMEHTIPDFAQTMKEYKDGILLFKAEQENVWKKVVPTDSALRVYYSQHHSEYRWPDRINIQEIFVRTDSAAIAVKKAMTGYTIDSLVAKKTKRKTRRVLYDTLKIPVAPISFDSAAAVFNTRPATRAKNGIWGLQPVSSNGLMETCWNRSAADSLDFFKQDNGFSFVKILMKDPAREKTFEEAQTEISGAYQEYETNRIENEWIAYLKKKYPVTINTEVLDNTAPSVADAPAKQ